MSEVGIIMGSDSDLQVMVEAETVLKALGVQTEILVVSAHRTPDKLYDYAKTAQKRGLKVIVAGAGGAAHLPGMVASMTVLPVIGVPIKTSTLNGIDSLLSIVQMPGGIPVATVAIGGGKNAGLLAARILATTNDALSQKLSRYQNELETEVLKKSEALERLGGSAYLAEKG